MRSIIGQHLNERLIRSMLLIVIILMVAFPLLTFVEINQARHGPPLSPAPRSLPLLTLSRSSSTAKAYCRLPVLWASWVGLGLGTAT